MSTLRQLLNLLIQRKGGTLTNIFQNTVWLVLDKGISLVFGLLVGVWVARYLGVDQFGKFNYAMSYILLFSPIVVLGVNDLVIRNIVRNPQDENETLGTAFLLQTIAAFLALILSVSIAYLVFPGQFILQRLAFIFSLGFIFQPFSNVISYWFQSQLQSKYLVVARNWALFIVSLLKIGFIFFGASLIAFVWANTVQVIIFSLVIFYLYKKNNKSIKEWKFSADQAQLLIQDSWPLIIAGLAVMVYTYFDQIMLSNMVSTEENGIYAAAVRLSELWYFIPVALSVSFFPMIVRMRETQKQEIYAERMQLFFDITTLSTYIIVFPLSVLAPWLVNILYGPAYVGAGAILRVHIWAFLFVSLGVSRSQWLITENLNGFAMVSTIMGAVINVGMNYILIPRYAGLGAAWATLISYAVSGYVSSVFWMKTRNNFIQLSLALALPLRCRTVIKNIWNVMMKNR